MKIGAFVLSLVLLLCLCGCANQAENSETPPTTTAQSVSTTVARDTGEQPSATEKTEASAAEISVEFKATMDGYEVFFDEYVDIVKRYTENPMDTTLLSEYTDYLARYSETLNAMNVLNDGSLTAAELAYYLEVHGRIMKKLASIL